MNKELIEEMASDMDFACVELSKEQRIEIARTLINLGYDKIPEGSIVIRNEKLQLGNWEGEVQTINMTSQTYDAVLKLKEKETAKEILNKLYEQINKTDPKWFGVQIKIIAKQYGVKVEE